MKGCSKGVIACEVISGDMRRFGLEKTHVERAPESRRHLARGGLVGPGD